MNPVVALPWRSALALAFATVLGLAAFGWPLLLHHGTSANGHEADAPLIVALLLVVLVAVVLAEIADGGIDSKALALMGVLAGCGSVLRILAAGVALTEGLTFFLIVPAAWVFGRGFGFLLGVTTMFSSALLTVGVGPWLPFQMIAAGWFGFLAGSLPGRSRLRGRPELLLLAGYGLVGSLVYGLIMDLSFWPFRFGFGESSLAFVPGASLPDNLGRFWAFHLATGMGWDVVRGIGTALCILGAGRPLIGALRRASRRAAFEA
jgi:energy-coupling factor transport system substrate-specific component